MGKKSISELWEHFWPYVNSNPYIVGSDEWQRWVNAVSHIRAELLERCKKVSDETGMASTAFFERVQEDDETFSEKEMVSIDAHNWCGQPKQLREFGAVCMFWAWELEQQEKEGGQNG